jgi:hypothetical protein
MHTRVGMYFPIYVLASGRQIARYPFPAGTKVGIIAPVLYVNEEIFTVDVDMFNAA